MSKLPHYEIIRRNDDLRATARKLLWADTGSPVRQTDGCSLQQMEKLLQQITFLTEELNTTRLEAARTREKLVQAEGLIWGFINMPNTESNIPPTSTCDMSTSTTELDRSCECKEDAIKPSQELKLEQELHSLQERYNSLQQEHHTILEQQRKTCSKERAQSEEHQATLVKLNQSYGAAVIKNNTLERQLKEARLALIDSEKRAEKQIQELRDTMAAQIAAKEIEIQRFSNEKCVFDGNKRVHFLSPIPTQSDDSIGLKPLRKAGMSVRKTTTHFLDSEIII